MALPLLLIAAWVGLVDTGLFSSPLLVPLHEVLAAPWFDPDGRQVWAALAASLLRMMAGCVIGIAAGVVVGMALGLSRRSQQLVAPTLHGVRQVALFAWIPLLTSWFGDGELAKIVLISLSAFFPTFLNTEQGVRGVPDIYREVAAVCRLPLRSRLFKLTLKAALPSILTGVELALLTAWIGTVGSEYAIGTGVGIGAYLSAARDLFRMDLVLVGVVLMALVGYGLNRISRYLFRTFIVWRAR
jgi:sulfonate transport system permease protein